MKHFGECVSVMPYSSVKEEETALKIFCVQDTASEQANEKFFGGSGIPVDSFSSVIHKALFLLCRAFPKTIDQLPYFKLIESACRRQKV
jgi:hypothetical protein